VGYETLIVDQAGEVATVTLNRPEARNALDFAMRRELLAALDEIEGNPTTRVVVLTGAGGHFCAGGDVKTMRRRHTAAEARAVRQATAEVQGGVTGATASEPEPGSAQSPAAGPRACAARA